MKTHTLTFWARRPTESELLRQSHHLTEPEAKELLALPHMQAVADRVNEKYKGGWCVIAQLTLVREVLDYETEKAVERYDRNKSNPNRRDWWVVKP